MLLLLGLRNFYDRSNRLIATKIRLGVGTPVLSDWSWTSEGESHPYIVEQIANTDVLMDFVLDVNGY